MARTNVPVQALTPFGSAIAALSWTNADQANDHYFINSGREVLLIRSISGSGQVVTAISVTDRYGRSGDIPVTTVADGVAAVGPFPAELWNQRGAGDENRVFFNLTDNTGLQFAVLQVPLAAP